MPDYRKMFDKPYLAAWDLYDDQGRPIKPTLTIVNVEQGELRSAPGSKVDRCPVITFKGAKKKFVVNKGNGQIISEIAGSKLSENWVGHRITLFAAPTTVGKRKTEGIRVVPVAPSRNAPEGSIQPPVATEIATQIPPTPEEIEAIKAQEQYEAEQEARTRAS